MNTKAFQNRIFQLVGKLWGKTTWQMLLLAFAIPFLFETCCYRWLEMIILTPSSGTANTGVT